MGAMREKEKICNIELRVTIEIKQRYGDVYGRQRQVGVKGIGGGSFTLLCFLLVYPIIFRILGSRKVLFKVFSSHYAVQEKNREAANVTCNNRNTVSTISKYCSKDR